MLTVIESNNLHMIVNIWRRHHFAQCDGAVLASEQCSDRSKALFFLVPIQHWCLRGGFFLVSRCGEGISHRLLKQGFVLLEVFRVLMVDLDELLAPVASRWSKSNKPRLFKQFRHRSSREFVHSPADGRSGENA